MTYWSTHWRGGSKVSRQALDLKNTAGRWPAGPWSCGLTFGKTTFDTHPRSNRYGKFSTLWKPGINHGNFYFLENIIISAKSYPATPKESPDKSVNLAPHSWVSAMTCWNTISIWKKKISAIESNVECVKAKFPMSAERHPGLLWFAVLRSVIGRETSCHRST